MGSISIRESIRWHPDEASEDTSTVVLTSPQRHFVDLRILRPANTTGPWPMQEETLPLDRLDWAIAGTSDSWPLPDGQGRHSQWKHWIDSRTTTPENATDEGDMFPQADGLTLEKGSMVNPATGRETAYEEVWRDGEPGEDAPCVVLRAERGDMRGEVVRLAGYCQGLVRDGEKIALERWVNEGESGWRRMVRMGEGVFPCEKVLSDEVVLKVGEKLDVDGMPWEVIEVS